MNIKLPVLLLAGILLAFGAFAACSDDNGGGTLSADEYFQELEDLSQKFDEDGSALDSQFDAMFNTTDEDEALEIARDLFSELASLFEDFVNDLDDLNAPDEIADEHDTAVEAGRAASDAVNDAAGALNDADSLNDAEAAFNELGDLEQVIQPFQEACVAIQAYANDNGHDVDLRCEE